MESCSRSQNSYHPILFVLNSLEKSQAFQGFRRIFSFTDTNPDYPTLIQFGGPLGDHFANYIVLVPHLSIKDQPPAVEKEQHHAID